MGALGTSSARSRARTWPVSTMAHSSLLTCFPTRKSAMSSIGFCVAERPMRVGRRCCCSSRSAARRSSDRLRCAPRLLPASAWISSTMTLRTVFSMRRPESELSRMNSDSGVVTRMCGGWRRIRVRSPAGVSPVRTTVRMSTSGSCCINSSSRMPASGSDKFFWMSLDSALSGEMYSTRVSSGSGRSRPSRTSSSMAARKAASVLPEPVGAAMRVCWCRRMAGQAWAWTSVARANWRRTHAAPAGWFSWCGLAFSLRIRGPGGACGAGSRGLFAMLPILFHAPLRDFVTVARWDETMICRGHSSSMNGLFLYCRAGFENECAAEIQFHAGRYGMAGYVKTKPDSGYVLLHLHEEGAAARLHADLPFAELIFTRQWFVVTALLKDLPVTDRVSALLAGGEGLPESPRELFLETPDTNEAKELSGLCRALQRPMEIAARIGKDRPSDHVGLRLHCCLLSGTAAYVGYASRRNSAPWAMGIPRLRFPGGATWQLVQRHLRVVAVDNGAIDAALMESGLVEHVRADGFRYRPGEPVDWKVCDIVEQPIRVAELAARWSAADLCRHSIFNLKLPMKKRYQEIQRCLALMHDILSDAGVDYRLACKQLYHDREEVTVYLRRL